MPGTEGGEEVNLLKIALLLMFVGPCSAQVLRQSDIEILPTVYGLPCEPGELQFGIFPCPPIEKQGVMIHVRSDDWRAGTHEGYLVTVTYRTAKYCEVLTSFPPQEKCTGGETKTVTCGGDNPCPKRKRDFGQDWDDGWRAIAFQIGRVATGPLSGITVESIAVTKIPAPAAVIMIGKTEFGVPK